LNHSATGIHCILELYGCPFDLLNDEDFLRQAVRQAARVADSSLLQLTSHSFSPQGVTALGLLAESHISIHTWPESGYAAADVFTCGRRCKPKDACKFLVAQLQAERFDLSVLSRGQDLAEAGIVPMEAFRQGKERCSTNVQNPPFG